jgi:hypothetical protein
MKTIRMPRDKWEKWDAALRSGRYFQGQGRLETAQGGHCCLGVLQMALDGRVERYDVDDTEGEDHGDRTDGQKNEAFDFPSKTWLQRHGIDFKSDESTSYNPYLPSLGCNASEANDDKGYDFIQIADAIKECVEFTEEIAHG